jgi:hypothetical protein
MNPANIQLGQFLVLTKPLGRPLGLAVGETVQARVIDVMPSGGLTLSINGTFIPARTGIPFSKGDSLLLKVAEHNVQTGQVNLQLLGAAEEGSRLPEAGGRLSDVRLQALSKLMDDLSGLVSSQTTGGTSTGTPERGPQGPSGAPATTQDSPDHPALERLIVKLIKALPRDGVTLPADVRTRLQALLQASLRVSGDTIRTRINTLVENLPAEMKGTVTRAISADVVLAAERPLASDLRLALRDTGVLLEAKLRGLSRASSDRMISRPHTIALAGDKDPDATQIRATLLGTEQGGQAPVKSDVTKDLKAQLLLIRQTLIEGQDAPQGKTLLRSLATSMGFESSESTGPHHGTLRLVDGLLRDIETYQLLSRATESFHTFLPVVWDRLRDGEISFRKKQKGSSRGLFSCRLTLDLERLGMLSAIIVMQNDRFTVAFRTDRPGLREMLTANMQDLEEAFLRTGLPLAGTSVAGADDRSFNELDAAWSLDGGLSVKV